MVQSESLADFLQNEIGVKCANRDLDKEKEMVSNYGMSPLPGLVDSLNEITDVMGVKTQTLADLELKKIPKGVNLNHINNAIAKYFIQRGAVLQEKSRGYLIFTDGDNKRILVNSSLIPDPTNFCGGDFYLVTVEENSFGLSPQRN